MAATTKRVLLWLGIAFVVYTIIESPGKAADMVQAASAGSAPPGRAWATSSTRWSPDAGAGPGGFRGLERLPAARPSGGWSPYADTGPGWPSRC